MKLLNSLAKVGASILLGASCLSASAEGVEQDAKPDAKVNEVKKSVNEVAAQVVENTSAVRSDAQTKDVVSSDEHVGNRE